MTDVEVERHKTNVFTYFTALVVGILVFTGGVIYSGSSPIIAHLKDKHDLENNPFGHVISDEEMTWFGSSEFIGRLFGLIPLMYLADKIGRKKVLILIAGGEAAAFTIIAFGKSIYLYCLAKLILGIGVGSAMSLTTLYLFEVGHSKDRGMLTVSRELFALLGDAGANTLGSYLSIRSFSLISALFPFAFLCIFSFFMPETPPYLLMNGKYQKAHQALKKLRNGSPEAIEEELKDMVKDLGSSKGGSACELVRNKIVLKSVFIVIALHVFKSFSGCQLLFIYTQQFFLAANTNISYKMSSIIFNVLLIPATIVSIWLARKVRNRITLGIVNFGAAFFCVLLGIYFYLMEHKTGKIQKSNVPVVYMFCIGSFFMLGMPSTPSVIASELFPIRLRSASLMIGQMVNFSLIFVLSKFFAHLHKSLGFSGLFWLFSTNCVIFIVFIVFCVPETKNRTIAEVQALLGGVRVERPARCASNLRTET